jgi:hypothetical protein
MSETAMPSEERTPTGQWLKGVSGNPETQFQPGNQAAAGRRGPITKLMEEIFEHAESSDAIKAQMLKTLTSKGMAGVLLLKEAADRIEGKVTQPMEIEGEIRVSVTEAMAKARERALKVVECLPLLKP